MIDLSAMTISVIDLSAKRIWSNLTGHGLDDLLIFHQYDVARDVDQMSVRSKSCDGQPIVIDIHNDDLKSSLDSFTEKTLLGPIEKYASNHGLSLEYQYAGALVGASSD